MRTVFKLAPLALALMAGCQKKQDPNDFITAASCESDKDCGEGFICKEKTCQKGERTPEELAAQKKAELEAKKKELAAKKKTKPGEGRLTVRICPYFKNTMESLGTIKATHKESGKTHFIDMALEVPEMGYQDVFTFYSLPLGEYDVVATYGIQVKGIPETHELKCHEDAKKACREETIREVEVVLPEKMPEPEKDEKGKPKKPPCDFVAE